MIYLHAARMHIGIGRCSVQHLGGGGWPSGGGRFTLARTFMFAPHLKAGAGAAGEVDAATLTVDARPSWTRVAGARLGEPFSPTTGETRQTAALLPPSARITGAELRAMVGPRRVAAPLLADMLPRMPVKEAILSLRQRLCVDLKAGHKESVGRRRRGSARVAAVAKKSTFTDRGV